MNFLEVFSRPDAWIALATLSAMEIVLGIDNVIFIAILVGRVPDARQRERLRRIGLLVALVLRVGLLFLLSWLMGLTTPLFTVLDKAFSGRDLILLAGGLFLIGKSAHEMYAKVEGGDDEEGPTAPSSKRAAGWILLQIALIDIVFSLDSVITAIGMANDVPVMVIAMLISVVVMLVFARAIGDFVERHPTIKILALSFLLLIGVLLLAESLGQHVAKGTVYFAMAFALGVELLNMRLRKKRVAVHLHGTHIPEGDHGPTGLRFP